MMFELKCLFYCLRHIFVIEPKTFISIAKIKVLRLTWVYKNSEIIFSFFFFVYLKSRCDLVQINRKMIDIEVSTVPVVLRFELILPCQISGFCIK